METGRHKLAPEADKVISPFADSEVTVSHKKGGIGKIMLILGASLFLIIAGVIGGVFVNGYLNDPYRTLQSFPVAKYYDDYQALAGSKFKAEFRVEADLGYKDGGGRLMLFSTSEDARPVAVLIPVAVANGVYFTKGQTYIAQIEVKEGGLIYADSFQKN